MTGWRMRAMVMSAHGGPEVLAHESSGPTRWRVRDRCIVRVAAVAVNRLDIWVREDVGHAYSARLPVVPGYDVAGRWSRSAHPSRTSRWGSEVYVHYDFACGRCPYCLAGDEAACAEYEVMGVQRDGGYAELVVAPARNIFALPATLSPDIAAAAGSVYLTAYRMLFARAGLRPGETVLVNRRRLRRRRRRDRARPHGRGADDRDRLDRGQA